VCIVEICNSSSITPGKVNLAAQLQVGVLELDISGEGTPDRQLTNFCRAAVSRERIIYPFPMLNFPRGASISIGQQGGPQSSVREGIRLLCINCHSD